MNLHYKVFEVLIGQDDVDEARQDSELYEAVLLLRDRIG